MVISLLVLHIWIGQTCISPLSLFISPWHPQCLHLARNRIHTFSWMNSQLHWSQRDFTPCVPSVLTCQLRGKRGTWGMSLYYKFQLVLDGRPAYKQAGNDRTTCPTPARVRIIRAYSGVRTISFQIQVSEQKWSGDKAHSGATDSENLLILVQNAQVRLCTNCSRSRFFTYMHLLKLSLKLQKTPILF